MKTNETHSKMSITAEEEKSIRDYFGSKHTSINLLADFRMDLYQNLQKKGWLLPTKPEEVKELVEDFVNIYSAMYKNSVNCDIKGLARGTEVISIPPINGRFNQFISTSINSSIARDFAAKYEYGAIVHFNLKNKIPFLDAEQYRDKDDKNESEIILSPFCKVNEKKEKVSFDQYQHYQIDIEAPEFESKSPEEIEQLREEVIQGFSENIQNMKKYANLEQERDYHNSAAERCYKQKNNEDYEYHKDKVKELNPELKIKKESVNQFREKMQSLLMGLCKQKEQEIDLAREKIAQSEKNDKILEIKAKAENAPEQAHNLNAQINFTYQEIFRQEKDFSKLANTLGIPYTKTMNNTQIFKTIEIIQNTIKVTQEKLNHLDEMQNESPEVVAEFYKNIKVSLDGINLGSMMTEDFSKITQMHVMQSEDEIKKNLYKKVQKTIQDSKIQKYLQEKEKLENMPIGLLGRITRKHELQKEKVNQLNLKIQLAQTTQPQEQEKYSVRDMLADMQVCAKTELNGNFPPKMLNLYTIIKQNFRPSGTQTFSEKEIGNLANKKIEQQKNKLPVPIQKSPRFFGKTKFQLNLLKQENVRLKSQIIEQAQKGNMSYIKVSDEPDAIAIFDSKLSSMKQMLTEQKEIGKDGPIVELWRS